MVLIAQDIIVKNKEKKLATCSKLTLEQGSITTIDGENGAGKTSFVKGLFSYPGVVVEGTISFEESEITKKSLEEKISLGMMYISQHVPNIEGLSPIKMLYGISKAKEDTSILVFKDQLENMLPKKLLSGAILTKHMSELSGGEKKRVEMISFLVRNPKVVFFDEVDAGVDAETISIFADIINQKKGEGTVCVVISHNSEFKKLLDVDSSYTVKDGVVKKTS